MRVLVAEPLGQQGLDLIAAEHDLAYRPGLTRDELLAELPLAEALVVRSQVKVDRAAFEAASRLVVVGRAGVGVDNIDLDAATAAGVIVVNAPTANTLAAAELTLGLMLALLRNIAAADASLRRGEWRRSEFMGRELRGATLGIIGLGRIGLAVADRALAADMAVIANDPYPNLTAAAERGIELVELDELLRRSDIVTLHVPLGAATRQLIDASALALMKPSAVLVNVARGGVVDEAALADALRAGRLAGAAFDVFEHEPPSESPLLDAPNTVLTPHLGASTAEAQVRASVEVAEQVLDVLAGRPARFAVNAPAATRRSA